MRMTLLVGMLAGLAACGGGQDSSGGGAPTMGRVDEGVHDRPPLAFRPVADSAPGTCDAELGANVMPSSTGSQCFHFAGEGITVAASGAKRSTSAAPPTAALDVLLTERDLDQFNALASQCFERSPACPAGQIAIVFEGRVHSAPTVEDPSFTGEISISGEQRDIEEMLRVMNQASEQSGDRDDAPDAVLAEPGLLDTVLAAGGDWRNDPPIGPSAAAVRATLRRPEPTPA